MIVIMKRDDVLDSLLIASQMHLSRNSGEFPSQLATAAMEAGVNSQLWHACMAAVLRQYLGQHQERIRPIVSYRCALFMHGTP